jgi:hypothetical protein
MVLIIIRNENAVKLSLIFGVLLAIPAIGVAQTDCPSFVGTTVKPIDFDRAIASLRSTPSKDEFETTAAYMLRLASIDNVVELIISKPIEDTKYLAYNADAGQLEVVSYAFSNISFNPWKAFYNSKSGIEASVNSYGGSNRGVVISETYKNTGSYTAQNSFSAQVTVNKQLRTTKSIFESREQPYSKGIFVNQSSDGIVGTLPMSPAEAKKFRSTAKIAFVVTPKQPYVVRSKYVSDEATMDRPLDETVNETILIADLRCGLLMNATNVVMLSLEIK